MNNEIHVMVNGNDNNSGTLKSPFKTITKAASIAKAGDTVIVHEGTYREWVKPQYGGTDKLHRITYAAADGEAVTIKGSEIIRNWEKNGDGVWKTIIDNSMFGSYNPYSTKLEGDWFMEPSQLYLHTGEVYVNNTALSETNCAENVTLDSGKWYSEVSEEYTTIIADLGDVNPSCGQIEINVRRSCFYPEKTGLNYITVRGFEMAHAASPWAPPTADQPAMLGVNWSKGWIIEDNILHDAKCSAISVGKEASTGDNFFTHYHDKPGYQYQLESVFKGRLAGWCKEKIGSHIIRRNRIYNCGQNGIVGNMGGAFSSIYENDIYNIGSRHEFFGFEIAGIKLHAAIDTQISHNRIHGCALGTWLDWQAQGTRLSSNLYYNNERDLWIEVTHGPFLADNNIFGSKYNISNAAQGSAFVHNLFCGAMHNYNVLNRSTPYHFGHSAEIAGTAVVYGFDDRFYNNIFAGDKENINTEWKNGTTAYNGCPESMEEFVNTILQKENGDVEIFETEKQPAYFGGNCYLNEANPSDNERNHTVLTHNPEIHFEENGDEVYIYFNAPTALFDTPTCLTTTASLKPPRITGEPFENPDGSSLTIDVDYFGNHRKEQPTSGFFENLEEGINKIKIWSTK